MTAASTQSIDTPDWSKIPSPTDDGAADHLVGVLLPSIPLQSTDGENVILASLRGKVVVYAYPRTGVPGQPNPVGWDMIPGARGCTPQCCAFSNNNQALIDAGVSKVFGLSTQSTEYQRELANRLHLPFSILSDNHRLLADALGLPTMAVSGEIMLKRLTMIIDDGRITKVFYPVFPPDGNAKEVLDFVSTTRGKAHENAG